MSEINLSSAVRTSLSSLQATANFLSSTQERLATGNRVNSALDDPTAFFTASALNNRASDLGTLLDAQQQAIRTVEVADQGITAIQDLVDSARAQATAALQTDDPAARAAAAAAFDDILTQIEGLAGDASFNGTNLLAGDGLNVIFNESGTSALDISGVDFTDAQGSLGLIRQSASAGQVGTATGVAEINFADLDDTATLTIDADGNSATSGDVVSLDLSTVTGTGGGTLTTPGRLITNGYDFLNLTNGDSLTINVDDGVNAFVPITVNFGAGPGQVDATTPFTDADEALAAINVEFENALVAAGFSVGDVVLTSRAFPGIFDPGLIDNELEVNSIVGDVSVTLNDADDTEGGGGGNVNTSFSSNFVAGVPGTDLTAGDVASAISALTGVSATDDGNTISVTSTTGNPTVTGGGLGGTISGTGFSTGDFATDADINNALSAIDSALSSLRSTAASLGSDLSTIQVRQDFTSNLINTLQAGAGDLTLADLNEEGANLLTLQTRQQLASTSLSFATQSDQSVLSLF